MMATRICVKNVPRYVTDEKLREHFAQKGEVTDAKIIRTRDGRTRQFGFVGFRSADEAEEAVKYFHRSFFDTSRLTCEIAHQIGSLNLPRPWSRHSDGSSAFKKSDQTDIKDSSPSSHKDGTQARVGELKRSKAESDLELQEFLQLMQPRLKTKFWANDTIGPAQETGPSPRNRNGKGTKIRPNKLEVKVVDGFERRVPINKGRTSERLTQSHVRFEDGSDSEDSAVEDSEAGPSVGDQIKEAPGMKTGLEEKSKVVNNQSISDSDYLKSRVKDNWSESEDEDDNRQEIYTDNMEIKGVISDGGHEAHEDTDGEGSLTGAIGPEQLGNLDGVSKSAEAVQETEQNLSFGIVDGEKQENVAETGRLFVRNLPYTASEEDLTELFSKFGHLSQVHLVLDKETKHSKGFAYVLFMLPEDAVRALENLDKSIFQGRLLHVLASHRPPPAPLPKLNQSEVGTTKYKTEREAQRKAAEANGDTRAWNTLFLRPDTVAENVAKKYGMTKSEFLDPEAGDLAVRMALGETQVIAETKRALSENGVDIEALEKMTTGAAREVQRSGRVILVKNLPFTTMEDDLVRKFATYGTLGRVILPATRTLALVEYLEAAEAQRAFKSLAYKRYQHVPLYLEWAPIDLLADPGPESARITGKIKKASDAVVGQSLVKKAEVEDTLMGSPENQSDSNAAQARSVFVKNLNFSTTREGLKKHFEHLITSGSLRSVEIKTKPYKNGKALSWGYGFLEFDTVETAVAVSKQFQGTVLDNHALVLQLSRSMLKEDHKNSMESKGAKQEKARTSTKLIVRNVAFEATRKDLHQLFSLFGQMKSLRLPKKFDGKHRGFAFVEFMTRQEAANAFSGLKNTHLYGRHLVLEQAKDAESLDQLRNRTAQQFFAENGVDTGQDKSSKKRKTSAAV